MTNTKRQKRLWQRGFNLIEVAIVVVVLGILGSAILVPLVASLVEEQYELEAANLERAKQAVIGYALRSETPGAVINFAGGTNAEDVFRVPPGRAYFPCPDITGDGNENRFHYDILGLRIDDSPMRLDVAANGEVTLTQFDHATDPDLKTVGACAAMRGFLPWQTLGLPRGDTWGNAYTYAVDYAYSHGIVGFNKNTLADTFYTHGFMEVDADGNLSFPRRAEFSAEVDGAGIATPFFSTNSAFPIGLCLGAERLCESDDIDELVLAFGDRADAAQAASFPRPYMEDDLRNGLVFVIVSHGRNGNGAGRPNFGGANNLTPLCNPPITDTDNQENANYPFVDNPANTYFVNDARFRNCNSQAIATRSAQFFTILRRNDINEDTAFDDVMTWATREEINRVITRESPDLPLYLEPVP